MSAFVWWFGWTEDQGWKRLSSRAIRDFHHGERTLPRCKDRLVRTAELVGEMEDRRPVGLLDLIFSKNVVDAKGLLTYRLRMEQMAAMMNSAFPSLEPRVPGVIPAQSHFYKRQRDAKYRWTPDEAVFESLCRTVNRAARCEMLVPRTGWKRPE